MAARSEDGSLMRSVKILLLAAAIAAARAGSAAAEISLESVHWQTGLAEGGMVRSWRGVKALSAAPKPADRMRASLVLKNEGPQNEEGLLLRYSLTARVMPDGGGAEGSWAIPFSVDERRVPKVLAGKTIEVPIDVSAAIDLYLRRMARAGWLSDRIKIQVMLEPHNGSKELQIVEDVLEVGRAAKKP